MKIGDVVRLKSGGPPTTVIRKPGEIAQIIDFAWFHEGTYRFGACHEDALDLVPNFSATSSAPMPADKPCRCGHDLYIEHSNVGCLQGCAHDLCAPEDGQHGL